MNQWKMQFAGKILAGGAMAAALLIATFSPVGTARAASGDFEWCPGATPHDDPTCVTGTSIQDVLNIAKADHTPGNVYVNAGAFNESPTISGLSGVTITGNANGGAGTNVVGTLTILKSKNISLYNFSFTTGITISGGSGAYVLAGNSGPLTISSSKFDKNMTSDGLLVNHDTGTVSLDRVSGSNNGTSGIFITAHGALNLVDITASGNGTYGGYFLTTSGAITIDTLHSKGNHFDKNRGPKGLYVSTPNSITVNDLTVSKNTSTGGHLDGGFVTLASHRGKANRFDGNGGDGLIVNASVEIVAYDLSASSNAGAGANLNSSGMAVITTNRGKMLSYNKNGGAGLLVNASGSVSVNDANASGNGSSGLNLTSNTDEVNIGTAKLKMIQLNKNGGSGVVASGGGLVGLFDASASGNGNDGAHLTGASSVFAAAVKSKGIHFNKNGGVGLYINSSSGDIQVKDTQATSNAAAGASLTGTSTVTVTTQVGKQNVFSSNLGSGLVISAPSTVTLKDIMASKNGLTGVSVVGGADVSLGVLHAKSNTISSNGTDGLSISAGSAISLAKVMAMGNTGKGVIVASSDDLATLSCSTVKSSTVFDIQASLGSADLHLDSVTLSHPGTGDVSMLGTGAVVVSTAGCS